jgi:hypothetical protein
MNFDTKIDELTRKPQSHITQEDAREIQATEGRAFNRPPQAGSVSAQVRSIANRNEALGLPPVAVDVPVYVTKDDAREAQHAESTVYGGQNPRGGMAAQMQSAADKIEYARRGSEWCLDALVMCHIGDSTCILPHFVFQPNKQLDLPISGDSAELSIYTALYLYFPLF